MKFRFSLSSYIQEDMFDWIEYSVANGAISARFKILDFTSYEDSVSRPNIPMNTSIDIMKWYEIIAQMHPLNVQFLVKNAVSSAKKGNLDIIFLIAALNILK